MVNLEKRAITEHFSNITDKRRYNKRHKLIDIIIIQTSKCPKDNFYDMQYILIV